MLVPLDFLYSLPKKEKSNNGATISHRTIPAKAKAVMIKKSETRSKVESKNPPNAVTLLYFLAIIPSTRSNILPTNARSAKRYHPLITKTKNSRDGILPSRVSAFGLTFDRPMKGVKNFSINGF